MAHRPPKTVLIVLTGILAFAGRAIAQSSHVPVNGSGLPGTVPVFTGTGNTLTNSDIQDNVGISITVGVPVQLNGTLTVEGLLSTDDGRGDNAQLASTRVGVGGVGVSGTGASLGVQGIGPTGIMGTGTNGPGIVGNSESNNGVVGTTAITSAAGVAGFNNQITSGGVGVFGQAAGPNGEGVVGLADASTGGGTKGVTGITNSADAGAMGVSGVATAASGVTFGVDGIASSLQGTGVKGESPQGVGLAGFNQRCTSTCVLTAGIAGFFVTGTGGTLLIGSVGPAEGPASVSTPVFRVDGTGKGFFAGGTQTGGADFAEVVAVRSDDSAAIHYEPGDVLAVDTDGSRRLTLSSGPYSTRVAGIYSTKPGVLATQHGLDDVSTAEVPLAIVGIVPCKVNTENGPIQPGDLLVSASRPGFAMKGTNRSLMLGAVVGKALQPLSKGSGVIEVLVTLQ